nr:hypothetical protein CFP56_55912 [Quercus suber]
MADDVINSMENMKLTTEEEEVITNSDEGRLEAIEDCNLSLMGKFLTCKPFNKRAAKSTMRRAWGLGDRVCIKEVAMEVGSRLGVVEEVEQRRRQDELNYFMRNCAAHFAVTKNGGTAEYQYGDFLKAMGGRPRVDPFVRKQGGSENSSAAGEDKSVAGLYRSEEGPIRSEDWRQRTKAVTAEEGQCKNPTVDDEGESVFSGNTPQVQDRDGENLGHADYVERDTDDVHNLVTDVQEKLIQKDDVVPGGLDGMASVSHMMGVSDNGTIKEATTAGPIVTKPKSSWTRFNRMDFGLGGLHKALLPSIAWRCRSCVGFVLMLAYGDLATHMDLNFGGGMGLYLASCIRVFVVVWLFSGSFVCVMMGLWWLMGKNSSQGLVVVVMDNG